MPLIRIKIVSDPGAGVGEEVSGGMSGSLGHGHHYAHAQSQGQGHDIWSEMRRTDDGSDIVVKSHKIQSELKRSEDNVGDWSRALAGGSVTQEIFLAI